MKILQVVHYFPPSGLGGSELHTCQLSQELLKAHDVRVFFTIPDKAADKTVQQGRHNGIPYWALGKNYSNFNQPFHERSRWVEQEFDKAVREFNPDIIHFQHLVNLSLGLPHIAKTHSIACCFTLHDFWLLCPRTFLLNQMKQLCPGYDAQRCSGCLSDRTGLYATDSRGPLPIRLFKQTAKKIINFAKKKLLYFSLASWRPSFIKKIFKDIDLFIAPSRFLMEKYIHAGVPSEKIVFCRHGFDSGIFSNIKKTSSSALRFAFIGGIRPHKGIDTLIAAFNRIPAPHELKIYGAIHPATRRELQEKITNPRIYIMGELKKENKKTAFADTDALILPSVCYENCPLVIGEAFMAKTPVIVSDLGGMAELVDNGLTGLTFTAGDSSSLAEKITLFINDPGLRERLTRHLPLVKDITVYTDEILKLYGSLIEAGRSHSPGRWHRLSRALHRTGTLQ
jgi:glycosyltransferase involved in cell wall biosynthesis